jgi:hypothetical protein
MNYWKHPTQRTVNIPAYPKGSLPAITGTTTYDWNSMKNTTTEYTTATQKNAVAKLMYECGVAVQMDYNTIANGGSLSNINSVYAALPSYFGYDNAIGIKSRQSYNNTDWENLLRSELDAGRPIYYRGTNINPNGGGHAFVCDGYKCDDGTFHFNWGWGGDDDGYFVTSALNVKGYAFNGSQGIIYNIKPNSDDFIYPDGSNGSSTFAITASESVGGSIVPEGSTYVYLGANQPYTFEAHSGYEIDQVWIDGVPNATAKANGYYIFPNITANHTIIVTFKVSASGIEVLHSQDISIYPNPAKDEIFIKSELQINKVEIYSLAGTLLISESNFIEKISVSNLLEGVYMLKVYSDNGVSVSKVVKE